MPPSKADRLALTSEEAAALEALRGYLPCARADVPAHLSQKLAQLEARGLVSEQVSMTETIRQVMNRGRWNTQLVKVLELDVRGINALRLHHRRRSERRA